MATQEIDVTIHTNDDLVTVAAADNTLANDLSLHWNDTLDKMELEDLLTRVVNAFREHQADDMHV